MNLGAVGMCFVNDVSGDVSEYGERVIFGKVHNV